MPDQELPNLMGCKYSDKAEYCKELDQAAGLEKITSRDIVKEDQQSRQTKNSFKVSLPCRLLWTFSMIDSLKIKSRIKMAKPATSLEGGKNGTLLYTAYENPNISESISESKRINSRYLNHPCLCILYISYFTPFEVPEPPLSLHSIHFLLHPF